MREHLFDASEPESIFSFLKTFRTACGSNRVSEGAAMSLFYYFMKKPSNAALSSPMQSKSSRSSYWNIKNGALVAYAELINHLMAIYETDDLIAGIVSRINSFCQARRIPGKIYSNALGTKLLCCRHVYHKPRLHSFLY